MQHSSIKLILLLLLQKQSEAFAPAPLHAIRNHAINQKLHAGTLIDSGDTAAPEEEDDALDITALVSEAVNGHSDTEISDDQIFADDEMDEQSILDLEMMKKAIQMAHSRWVTLFVC